MSDEPVIVMHRRGSMLIAHGPLDEELIREYGAGRPLRIRISQARNVRGMRYYWGLLTLLWENMETPPPSVSVLHGLMKVALGYAWVGVGPKGEAVMVPLSVAFDQMEEPAFRQYVERFKDLVEARYLPEIRTPIVERAVRELLGGPLEPETREALRQHRATQRRASAAPDEDDENLFGAPADDDEDGPPISAEPPDEEDDGPSFSLDDGAADEVIVSDATTTEAAEELPPNVDETIRQMAEHKARLTDPVMGAREPPPGLDERERTLWFDAYDTVKGGRPSGLAPGETVDPETGEVTEAEPKEERRAPAKPRGPEAIATTTKPVEDQQPSDPPPPTSFDSPASGDGVALVSMSHPDVELDAATDWPRLKRLYRERLACYILELEPEGVRLFKLDVWERLGALADAPAPTEDYDALWLWLEFGATTKDEIDGVWPTFWRSRAYATATPDEQSAIAGLMIERQKALKR